jgi:hypothetical protein
MRAWLLFQKVMLESLTVTQELAQLFFALRAALAGQ